MGVGVLNFVTSGARDEDGTEISTPGARQMPSEVGGHDRAALVGGRKSLASPELWRRDSALSGAFTSWDPTFPPSSVSVATLPLQIGAKVKTLLLGRFLYI